MELLSTTAIWWRRHFEAHGGINRTWGENAAAWGRLEVRSDQFLVPLPSSVRQIECAQTLWASNFYNTNLSLQGQEGSGRGGANGIFSPCVAYIKGAESIDGGGTNYYRDFSCRKFGMAGYQNTPQYGCIGLVLWVDFAANSCVTCQSHNWFSAIGSLKPFALRMHGLCFAGPNATTILPAFFGTQTWSTLQIGSNVRYSWNETMLYNTSLANDNSTALPVNPTFPSIADLEKAHVCATTAALTSIPTSFTFAEPSSVGERIYSWRAKHYVHRSANRQTMDLGIDKRTFWIGGNKLEQALPTVTGVLDEL